MTSGMAGRNPFYPLRADSILENEIARYFFNHSKSLPLMQRGNHLVVGASGTGKTAVLKHLSFAAQYGSSPKGSDDHPDFVGLYTALKRGDCWSSMDPTDEVVRSYEYFLTLDIEVEIARAIRALSPLQELGVAADKALGIFEDTLAIQKRFRSLEEVEKYLVSLREELRKACTTRQGAAARGLVLENRYPSVSTVPRLTERIVSEAMRGASDGVFYLLLDQYDQLCSWQQRVVNLLVRRPAESYCVKIGTKPYSAHEGTATVGRNVWDALEGVIDLQFYRSEAQLYLDVATEVIRRRLYPQDVSNTETTEGRLRALLPQSDPVEVARTAFLGHSDALPFVVTRIARDKLAGVFWGMSKLARDTETQRQLRCAFHHGLDRIIELSDGNVGLLLNLLGQVWEVERASRKANATHAIDELTPRSQVRAVWNVATLAFRSIESEIEGEGVRVAALVEKLCEEWESSAAMAPRSDEDHDVELPSGGALSADVVGLVQKAIRHGSLVPTTSAGQFEVPQKLNIRRVYLPKFGLLGELCPCKALASAELADVSSRTQESLLRPIRGAPPPPATAPSSGFLSVSFRNSDPAAAARRRIQELFEAESPAIECFDLERLKQPVGTKGLLTQIREEIHKHAAFCLVELSNPTPNVMIEFGLIKGLKKVFWALCHEKHMGGLPSWLGGLRLTGYGFAPQDRMFLDKQVAEIIGLVRPIALPVDFCPIWGDRAQCNNPATKDVANVYVSFATDDFGRGALDTWPIVSGELREVLAQKGKRLVLVEETLLKHSSQRVCYWCHAIRSSGAVFVDTTPTEADKKIDLNNNLTQCFILGVAAGQRQRNRTYCFHLFHEQNGKQIPLWNGYPEQPWNDSQEIKKIILGQVEKLSKASPRGAS